LIPWKRDNASATVPRLAPAARQAAAAANAFIALCRPGAGSSNCTEPCGAESSISLTKP
jgi:hypothetical protein